LQEFRPDIQGLRAVAIVPVVAYHAFGGLVPGGFVGVDVFFVISGFLITRILVREIEAGSFSVAAFYARRVRRLFPALFAMLAATLVAGLALLPPEPLAALGTSTAWTAIFAANFHQERTLGYFAEAAELQPLLHTWSLGVEEQFYITFPLFLAAVHRFFPRRLRLAVWMGVLGSLAWSVRLVMVDPDGAFYLPQSRAFELGIGALLALGAVPTLARASARVRDALSLTGIGMIVAAFVAIDARTPYPGLAALLPCLGTALVIHAGDGRETAAARLLRLAPLQYVGAVSYSLYLWHWPVLVFTRYVVLDELDAAGLAAALAIAFGLASLSYHWIERPVLGWRAGSMRVFAGGVALVLAVGLVGLAVARSDGLPQRFDARSLDAFAAAGDFSRARDACHFDGSPANYARSCVFGAPGAPATVAVWADSFGAELSVALGERLTREGRAVRQLTASSCPPALGYNRWNRPLCARHNRAMLDALVADPAIETVVLFADYGGYGDDRPRVIAGLREAALALHAAGKRIVLVYPLPTPRFDVPKASGLIAWRGGDPQAWGARAPDPAALATERSLDALARAVDGEAVRPAVALCANGFCRTTGPDGAALYFDDRHLSLSGARLVLDRQPRL
jgi:peptidoglycan/LPS O-acetylase OafA/YrhL